MSLVHQNLALHRCVLCLLHAHYHCGWATFAFSSVSCIAIFLVGKVWHLQYYGASLGWFWACSWIRPDACPQPVCQNCGHTYLQGTVPALSSEWLLFVCLFFVLESETCSGQMSALSLSFSVAVTTPPPPSYRVLSLCCPLWGFCWWTGPAVISDVFPKPTSGASVELVCMIVFPSHQSKSHFGVALATVRAACRMKCSRHSFGRIEAVWMEQSSGECGGRAHRC